VNKADQLNRRRSSSRKPTILLTGFEPFGGERANPSWEIAKLFDQRMLGSIRIRAARMPVNHRRAIARLKATIEELSPVAIVGLGQAGGRPALSLERVAINLVDQHRRDGSGAGHRSEKPAVRGGPDAYFSRLPLASILSALRRNRIPASFSLSAGAFICNTVMYAALHETRQSPSMPVGFIHLPYATDQAARHPSAPTMSLATMERGIEIALQVVGRAARLKPTI
jgi:pyroglutamyl-peptidase